MKDLHAGRCGSVKMISYRLSIFISCIQNRTGFSMRCNIVPFYGCRARISRQFSLAHSEKASESATGENPTERRNILFIGSVWPERSSSAAGVRTSDIIRSFQERECKIMVAAGVAVNSHAENLQKEGIQIASCPPNRTEEITGLLQSYRPDVVIFDRYYTEEMYSFRVKELAPNALRILDMQDCHFVRESRKKMAQQNATLEDILKCRPDASSASCLLRELASIYRSDLTLVCSPTELDMLLHDYSIPRSKLILAPFFVPTVSMEYQKDVESRKHICMIGCFNHAPNADSVKWCVNEIWPIIRKKLSTENVELHVYGSYMPDWAKQMHNPKKGVHMKGFLESLDEISHYRLLLAPLRFGAGLKGKIVDAWYHGTPVVTTPIGAEGMTSTNLSVHTHDLDKVCEEKLWGGEFNSCRTSVEIGLATVDLYSNLESWKICQKRGFQLLHELYDAQMHFAELHQKIHETTVKLNNIRAKDYLGAILWQQQYRATEYFSRWIELKEKSKFGNSLNTSS